MRYEWDEAKSRINFIKHGLSFEDAELVFAGPCVTFVYDRFDYVEERLITLASSRGGWWSSPMPRATQERASSR
jgi:uncharacterized DUF497 family protein